MSSPNQPPSPAQLSRAIKAEAQRLGFDLCRIRPVGPAPHGAFFRLWIQAGRAGEMGYLERHLEKRLHPARLTEPGSPPLRSIIVLGVDYHQFDLPPALREDPSRGIIASYAWGDDYHEIIRPLLHRLDAFIRQRSGRTSLGKALVDTGPVLERDWAQEAGLGFIGKNCCTIRPGWGSWLFLATLTVPEELAPDPGLDPVDAPELAPEAVLAGLPGDAQYGSWRFPEDDGAGGPATGSDPRLGSCGRCTRCLAACPTEAFTGPFSLDPLRCISYWTIEARSPIPRPLRPLFGNRIFGCDICQEVCPWNQQRSRRRPRSTPRLAGLAAHTERVAPPLLEGFRPETPYWLDEAAFRERFRRSPVKRAKRWGMLRNVCVALGNWAEPETIPALVQALGDPHPLPRGHAAWALGQVLARRPVPEAQQALAARLAREEDGWVQEEIRLALAGDGGRGAGPGFTGRGREQGGGQAREAGTDPSTRG